MSTTLCRLFIITLIAFALSACGSSGACVGEYGAGKEECKEGWDKAECDQWDEDQINGSSWAFYSGDSCSSLGFENECFDGPFVEVACP